MTRAHGAGWKPPAQAAANYMPSMVLKQFMNVCCSQAARLCSLCNVLPLTLRLATSLVMYVVQHVLFILMSMPAMYLMGYLFILYLDCPQVRLLKCWQYH